MIRFVANQENCNEAQIDNAWQTIQDFATEILTELSPPKKTRPSRPALRKLDRTHSQRFSFTRNVSQEIYERQSSMYVDDCHLFVFLSLYIHSHSQTKTYGRRNSDRCDRHRRYSSEFTARDTEKQRSCKGRTRKGIKVAESKSHERLRLSTCTNRINCYLFQFRLNDKISLRFI